MSSILDALRKAGEDRAPVRSPLVRGELYKQTQVAPSMRATRRSGWLRKRTATTVVIGAFAVIAVGLVGLTVWTQVRPGPDTGATVATGAARAGIAAGGGSRPAEDGGEGPAAAGPGTGTEVEGATAQTRRLVDEYLSAQLLPTVPINVASDGGGSDGGSESGTESAGGDETTAGPEEPRWVLEGVVWDARKPMAIINGRILGVGDTVDGALVSSIAMNSVIITVNGQDIRITY